MESLSSLGFRFSYKRVLFFRSPSCLMLTSYLDRLASLRPEPVSRPLVAPPEGLWALYRLRGGGAPGRGQGPAARG